MHVSVKTVVLRIGPLDFPDSDASTEPESSIGGLETNTHEETFSVLQLISTFEPGSIVVPLSEPFRRKITFDTNVGATTFSVVSVDALGVLDATVALGASIVINPTAIAPPLAPFAITWYEPFRSVGIVTDHRPFVTGTESFAYTTSLLRIETETKVRFFADPDIVGVLDTDGDIMSRVMVARADSKLLVKLGRVVVPDETGALVPQRDAKNARVEDSTTPELPGVELPARIFSRD